MYIGPQGIVHGTTITLLNAVRMKKEEGVRNRKSKLFVSSGLGGMSGAQPKAAVIAGLVGVVAEVNPKAVQIRHSQGWVDEVYSSLDQLIKRIKVATEQGESLSIAYQGNVVELWERLADAEVEVDLGSDQTSLHNPWSGGYYPVGYSFEDSNRLMAEDPLAFKAAVQASLRRHVAAINKLAAKGMYFFDYGNAFLLESSRAGADVTLPSGDFKYSSYVQDIMGPLFFDYGFGPFRWVCTSSNPEDLEVTDRIALEVLEELMASAPAEIVPQLADNILWIQEAGKNKLVVGSQARILYADAEGRTKIALAMNRAIREGKILAPVVLGRDHHDVSGTDSPYRETSNIYDGSRFCADMAVQNVIGDAFRGATWVSLHNGGGVGWGEVMNGGFGMVIDGSDEADRRIRQMLHWDVNNGITRRAWARNSGAIFAIEREMERTPLLKVTLPFIAKEKLVEDAIVTTKKS
ncbi:MAG: urocanate hydratase, partial [Prevotellaceae bacterium]|jgi:urocanate hydratase|nr:urocanate hydratase [Prevotellaceae bacterium]